MSKLNAAARAVAQLIAQRDDMPLDEAEDVVSEAIEACEGAIYTNEGDPEEIWMDLTGLEPDYMIEVLL